eukprot:3622009-Prymnesium_polylepis.1
MKGNNVEAMLRELMAFSTRMGWAASEHAGGKAAAEEVRARHSRISIQRRPESDRLPERSESC